MKSQPVGTDDMSAWSFLEVLNGVLVALGVLHIRQLQASSVTREFLVNTEVNVNVSSYVHLQESKSKVLKESSVCM